MRSEGSVHPPTDPAVGSPAPGVGAPAWASVGTPAGAPAGAPPEHHWLRGVVGAVRDTGDTDSWHEEVIPGGTDMGGVGRGAGATRFVTGE